MPPLKIETFYEKIIRNSPIVMFWGDIGVGKTTIALQLAKKVINNGKKVFYLHTKPSQTFSQIIRILKIKKDEIPHFSIWSANNFSQQHKIIQKWVLWTKKHKVQFPDSDVGLLIVDELTNWYLLEMKGDLDTIKNDNKKIEKEKIEEKKIEKENINKKIIYKKKIEKFKENKIEKIENTQKEKKKQSINRSRDNYLNEKLQDQLAMLKFIQQTLKIPVIILNSFKISKKENSENNNEKLIPIAYGGKILNYWIDLEIMIERTIQIGQQKFTIVNQESIFNFPKKWYWSLTENGYK